MILVATLWGNGWQVKIPPRWTQESQSISRTTNKAASQKWLVWIKPHLVDKSPTWGLLRWWLTPLTPGIPDPRCLISPPIFGEVSLHKLLPEYRDFSYPGIPLGHHLLRSSLGRRTSFIQHQRSHIFPSQNGINTFNTAFAFFFPNLVLFNMHLIRPFGITAAM